MPAPPSNDDCVMAIAIPSDSLPYWTDPVDMRDATAVGEPALCSTTSRTVWYTFTPSETATYEFTTCPEAAPANNLYSVVLAVLTAPSCADPFTTVRCTYQDVLCGEEIWQPRVTASLTAGTAYYVAAGSIATPVAGKETLQIRVARAAPPANDRCDSATPLTLLDPMPGSFAEAQNDYVLPNDACYSLPAGPPAPVGQTPSTAPGRDLVYSFTPSSSGDYSFRVEPYGPYCCSNLVLYASTACESGSSPEPVDSCIGAASRDPGSANWYGTEEIVCLPLVAGQTYYAYVDETSTYTFPSQFRLTARPCEREVEPNDTPAQAQVRPSAVVGATGTANDFDYYPLGAPPAGSRVFAIADQAAGNTRDIRMRITDATSTLEFDDNDNATLWGDLSPNIAGRALDGAHSYIQISPNSTTTLSEPYRLTWVVQPPGTGYGGSSASPNSGNNSPPNYNAAGNMFFSGMISPQGDIDRFTICAHAGDEIFASLDADPLRDNTPFDGSLTIWNTHAIGIGFYEANAVSDNASGNGSLVAFTPNSPADAMTWTALETGRHRINVNSVATGPAATGDYLLSIAVAGKIGAEQSVDLGISASDSTDPAPVGSLLTYTVDVTNSGPDIALIATMTDSIPVGTTFDSLEGSGSGGTWTCTLPAVGTSGTILCENPCFEDGGSYTFTTRVRLAHCLGDGTVLTNSASIVTLTTDSNVGNDASSTVTTVADGGCDDAEPCTVDSCDPALGCQHAAIPWPAWVGDGVRLAKTVDGTEISWGDPDGPFNVYRGDRAGAAPWSYNHSCVALGIDGPYTDSTTPDALELHYYFVSRENSCGQESDLGHDSQGVPVPNLGPCS